MARYDILKRGIKVALLLLGLVMALNIAPLTKDSSNLAYAVDKCGAFGGSLSPGNPFDCCANKGNCTWWAWRMAKLRWGVDFPARRNAKYWIADIAQDLRLIQ